MHAVSPREAFEAYQNTLEESLETLIERGRAYAGVPAGKARVLVFPVKVHPPEPVANFLEQLGRETPMIMGIDVTTNLRRFTRNKLYSWRFGRRFVFLKHLYFPFRLQENQERSFYEELLLEGKTVYDIGANIGLLTLMFSRLVGDNGRVYSFEPNSDVFGELVSNLKIARITNTHCMKIGLGDTRRVMRLYVPENNTGQGSANESVASEICSDYQYETYDIDVYPLDEFLDKNDLDMPDLVKIDVEGMELSVIRGMTRLLAQHGPDLLVEVHEIDKGDRSKNAREIIAYLEKAKYEMVHVENKGDLLGTADADTVLEGHIYATKQAHGQWAQTERLWKSTLWRSGSDDIT